MKVKDADTKSISWATINIHDKVAKLPSEHLPRRLIHYLTLVICTVYVYARDHQQLQELACAILPIVVLMSVTFKHSADSLQYRFCFSQENCFQSLITIPTRGRRASDPSIGSTRFCFQFPRDLLIYSEPLPFLYQLL